MVLVRDSTGTYRLGRALLDSCSQEQKHSTTGPMLQKTLFGWVVTGKSHPQQSRELAASFKLDATSIDDHIKRLWEIESFETSKVLLKPEHRACEEHYVKTTVINDSGRIVVRLPFKNNPSQLGHSFDIARHRFLSLERRLAQSSELRLQYCQFMEEYERLEYMSLVTEPNLSEPHYSIPHHCVLKPSSESTKLRVIFDASCRTSNQTSLNDHLLVGPTLQDDLYLLLLRFRLHHQS
ncbi:uncharacterized protein LOC122322684 [Drosophila grimshawi]|uniref:uncharacterized protein LOC122322684 n=1 Tax=Drosophila grimshawi TaxID=7222 RepID=UPI001C935CA7|nr:uncharacterized protein LOC122322684 [Drosophila grimshawi]